MILMRLITLRVHRSMVGVIGKKMAREANGKESEKLKNTGVAQKISINHLLNS